MLSTLPGRGRWQDKVIKQIPQTFADLGPTYVKFGQIIASSPGAFGESLSREFRGLLDAVPPANTAEVHKLLKTGTRRRPGPAVRHVRRGAVRVGLDRSGALRHPAQR